MKYGQFLLVFIQYLFLEIFRCLMMSISAGKWIETSPGRKWEIAANVGQLQSPLQQEERADRNSEPGSGGSQKSRSRVPTEGREALLW